MKEILSLSRVPKILLLDMDDTLVDSEGLNQDLIERFFLGQGKRMSAEERDLIPGASVLEIFETLCPKNSQESLGRFIEFKVRSLAGARIRPATGLETLLALPILKVIVSGSAKLEIDAVLEAARIDTSQFAGIYPIEMYVKGKPDPAGYSMAMADFNIHPSDCLVLEDSRAGVDSARAAGCEAVFVNEFSRHPGITNAEYYAESIHEVALVLHGLLSRASGTEH